MSRDNCSLEREELVAWHEGTLDPQRSAELAVHVDQCPTCRRQIETATEIDEVFQHHWPLVTDQEGERRTIAALYGFEPAKPNTRRLAAAIVTAFILPILAVLVLWPPPTAADSGIAGLVNVGRQHVGQTIPEGPPVQRVTLTGIPGAMEYIAPEDLPLKLSLIDQDNLDSDGLSLHYASEDLEILISQKPVEAADGYIDTDSPGYLVVKGIHVAYLRDPRPDAVASMIWERHDIQFALMALRTPGGPDGGLHIDDAVKIVKALFDAQDDTEERVRES